MPSANTPYTGANQSTIYPANLRSIATSCGDIFQFAPDEKDYGIIPQSVLDQETPVIPDHPMTIPVYGYMSPDLITRDQVRFYGPGESNIPTKQQLLRAMYDYGTIVIWYDSLKIPAPTLNEIHDYVGTHFNVVAIPWTGKILPYGRLLAYSTWGNSQSCNTWAPAVLDEFMEFSATHTLSRPMPAPEAKLNKSGGLFLIDPDNIYTQE